MCGARTVPKYSMMRCAPIAMLAMCWTIHNMSYTGTVHNVAHVRAMWHLKFVCAVCWSSYNKISSTCTNCSGYSRALYYFLFRSFYAHKFNNLLSLRVIQVNRGQKNITTNDIYTAQIFILNESHPRCSKWHHCNFTTSFPEVTWFSFPLGPFYFSE